MGAAFLVGRLGTHRRPKNIHRKLIPEVEAKVVRLRRKTGYEAWKIQLLLGHNPVDSSEPTIKRAIMRNNLSNGLKMAGKRLKWVRWQRSVPNGLWQLDHTEEDDGTLRLPIVDDCSRYCLAIRHYDGSLKMEDVITLLDEITAAFGTPRHILTDNGSIYQRGFDIWCRRRGIEHIRSGINKSTTVGKAEKFHDTYNGEIGRHEDPEHFRHTYNTMRPHRGPEGKAPSEAYDEFHRLLYFKRQKKRQLK